MTDNEKKNIKTMKEFRDFVEQETMNMESTNQKKNSFNYHNIYEEIEFWLESIPFSSFVNSISKEVIGQEGLTILLGNVYNYLYNIVNE